MKLVCPKCNLRLSLPDKQVPATGAWALCPRCRERFFINPAAVPIEKLTRPAAAPGASGPAPRGRDQASQRLLENMKNKRGLEDEAPRPDLITVYPRPAVSETLYLALGALLLCLPVVGIVALFQSAAGYQPAGPPAPAPTALSKVNHRENEESIRKDLVGIRNDLANRRRSVIDIEHSGPQARVFKYFMGRLAPDICSGIYRLEMTPSESPSGFTARGHCLEPDGRILEMRVDWAGSEALVSFPEFQQSEELDLYPLPEARVAAPSARRQP
jgi:hypothetical protein